MDSALAPSLRLQAKACLALGSPFHAGVLDLAAEDLDAGGLSSRRPARKLGHGRL